MESINLLEVIQQLVHYGLHFLFPALLAWIFFRNYWKKAWLIMLGTMLVDLDHLLSSPIFDPARCSIGYHIFHTEYAIAFYIVLLLIPKTRVIGLGLTLHMIADSLDCLRL